MDQELIKYFIGEILLILQIVYLIFLAYFDLPLVHFGIFNSMRLYCPTSHLNCKNRLVLPCTDVSELLG